MSELTIEPFEPCSDNCELCRGTAAALLETHGRSKSFNNVDDALDWLNSND